MTEHVVEPPLAERILAELSALRSEVAAIRSAQGERERLALPRAHLAVVAPLAAEIAAGVGSAAWSCRELFDYATRDPQLRAAIVAAIGDIRTGSATKRLGQLLARAAGFTLPTGYRIERAQDDIPLDCASWRVMRV